MLIFQLVLVVRVVQSRKDRGIILLIGDRFVTQPVHGMLPPDWRRSTAAGEGDWLGRVATFRGSQNEG